MNFEDLPIEIVSARRAVDQADIDIDVPEGEARVFGPSDELVSNIFRWATVTSFDDLKILGLVPEEMDNDRLLGVIREDSQANSHLRANRDCDCQHDRRALKPARKVHSALLALMRETASYEIHDQHPAVLKVSSVVSRFITGRLEMVGVASLQNINIASHARLTFTPSVSIVRANEINIGNEGRMRFLGRGITVRAKALNGPNPFLSPFPFPKVRPVGWAAEVKRKQEG